MRSKSIVLLALALGCGLVASIGISQVMERRNQATGTPGETEAVLVALHDINPNEAINAENVKIEEWPKSKLQPGVLTKPEEYENKRARQKIFAGEQLVAARLIDEKELTYVSKEIPKGFRVIPVRVDAVSGNAGLIVPGDRVDVLAYLAKNPTHDIMETQTKCILQDIKVFAVDDITKRDPGEDQQTVVAKTISLLVTPAQAQKITLASELGTIRLSMRNEGDDQIIDTDSISAQEVLGLGGSNRSAESAKPAQPNPSTAAASSMASASQSLLEVLKSMKQKSASAKQEEGPWKMKVFKGASIEEMQIGTDGMPVIIAEAGEPTAPAAAEESHGQPDDESPQSTDDPIPPTTDDAATDSASTGPRVSLTD